MAPRNPNPIEGKAVVVNQKGSNGKFSVKRYTGKLLTSDKTGATIQYSYRGKDVLTFVPVNRVFSINKLDKNTTRLDVQFHGDKRVRGTFVKLDRFSILLQRETRGEQHLIRVPFNAFASVIFAQRIEGTES